MDVRWVSDGYQMGVGFVTAQSTRHMHYIMTCLSGDCVVLVTITVTTNLCTKETLCSPGVGCVRDRCQMGVRCVSNRCQMRVRKGVRKSVSQPSDDIHKRTQKNGCRMPAWLFSAASAVTASELE